MTNNPAHDEVHDVQDDALVFTLFQVVEVGQIGGLVNDFVQVVQAGLADVLTVNVVLEL